MGCRQCRALQMSPQQDLPTLVAQIRSVLASRHSRRLDVEHTGRAAVLIPVMKHLDGFAFLLTRRTHNVQTHKGQISFPGGVQDPADESLLQTALRETREEIGLQSAAVSILGEFDEYLSVTGLIVTSFVAWLHQPVELTPSPDEVEEILLVPFDNFHEQRLLRTETRVRFGQEQKVYFYDFNGQEVWGLTAQIIRDFLQLLQGI